MPPLALAKGLIETLNIPFNGSLVAQLAECIKAKARASGISFAEAHDYIRDKASKAKPAKWLFWFRDAQYDAPVNSTRAAGGNGDGYVRRTKDDLPLTKILELQERRPGNGR